MFGIDVDDRLLQHQIVFFGFSNLPHDPVGPLEDRLEFFVLAGVEIFLGLTPLALQVAVLVDPLLLAACTLGFG